MKTAEPKPIIVKKSVKHTFTTEEVAELNLRFRQSFQSLTAAKAEFESVKAVHKGKISEAEAKMETLNATLNAGFEMREKECWLVYDVPKKEKRFFIKSDAIMPQEDKNGFFKPVAIEPMTQEDFQRELIASESAVEKDKAE